VILLIGGMSVTITGGLLFAVSAKLLPYYENGFYGLLLVVFALQFMMLGKTPLGDMKRSGGVLFSAPCFSQSYKSFLSCSTDGASILD